MSRYKVKSSRIFIAALVILLCLVSVTGATLALFTSNENDGTIGINATSGSVKVDIVDTTEEQNSLVGKVLNFMTTKPQDEILFEPGATYYTQGFRIKNKGSIPLNFILYVSEDDTVAEDFSDAFEAWITEDPANLATAVRLQDYAGRLEVGQSSKVFYLVFRMKETAGNEYQDRTFTGVGITVCAVQGNGYINTDGIDNAYTNDSDVE